MEIKLNKVIYTGIALVGILIAYFTSQYTGRLFTFAMGELLGGFFGAAFILFILKKLFKLPCTGMVIAVLALSFSTYYTAFSDVKATYKINSVAALMKEGASRIANGIDIQVEDFEYKSAFEGVVMTYVVGTRSLENRALAISQQAMLELEIKVPTVRKIIDGEITKNNSVQHIDKLNSVYIDYQNLAVEFELQSKNFPHYPESAILEEIINKAKANVETSKNALGLQASLFKIMGNQQALLIKHRSELQIDNNMIVINNQKVVDIYNQYEALSTQVNDELVVIQSKYTKDVNEAKEAMDIYPTSPNLSHYIKAN